MATQPAPDALDVPLLIERYRAKDGISVDVARLRSSDLPTRRQVVIDAVRLVRDAHLRDSGGAWRAVVAALEALETGEQMTCTHCGDAGVNTTVVATSGELDDPEGTGCFACDADGEPWLCDACLPIAANSQLDSGIHDYRAYSGADRGLLS